jgi:hypothetical protein
MNDVFLTQVIAQDAQTVHVDPHISVVDHPRRRSILEPEVKFTPRFEGVSMELPAKAFGLRRAEKPSNPGAEVDIRHLTPPSSECKLHT